METDIDKMSNEEFQKLKSEKYARQLVWHAFYPEVENLEENKHAKDIYERLKAGLERFFLETSMPPAAGAKCPLCGQTKKEQV